MFRKAVAFIMTTIAESLAAVRDSLARACLAAGRAPESVQLLAVSKTQPPQAVRAAFAAGQRDFGENYVQEALAKMDALADLPLCWHCIGPVQGNKTRVVAERFAWVHSVDRLRIAQRLSEQRPPALPPIQVCLQLNIDGEASKSGVEPERLVDLALEVVRLPRLHLRGLMTIPQPRTLYAEQLAVHHQAAARFAEVRAALDGLSAEVANRFDTLSMGMSADLSAAVAAGSTLVRVGTAIFGARPARAGSADTP